MVGENKYDAVMIQQKDNNRIVIHDVRVKLPSSTLWWHIMGMEV